MPLHDWTDDRGWDSVRPPRRFSFADALTSGLDADPPPLPFAAADRVGEVVPVGEDLGSLVGVWRRLLEAGQPLPTLPLPLSVHQSVPIDLEQTHRRAAERAYLN